MYLVTANEMQAMDRQTIETYGIPGRVLMENAGRGATQVFVATLGAQTSRKVGIIAGRGNNGGDGFVMARYLAHKDFRVTVFLMAQRTAVQGDAASNLALLDDLNVPVIEIPDRTAFEAHLRSMRHQQIWIDAILGTGLNSDVRGYYRTVIENINAFGRPVLAVDIPSGLNADTGQPCGVCVRAGVTVTFGHPKIGHLLYPGAEFTGDLHVIDIGIPGFISQNVGPRQFLLTTDHVRSCLPARPAAAHKGTTGHLLVVAGSTGKTGAAAMTASSALRAGAGLVTLGIPASLNPGVETQVLEAMTVPLPDDGRGRIGRKALDIILAQLEGKKALALGPGLGTDAETCALVHHLLQACPVPVVLDADGINCLARDRTTLERLKAPLVLTPHPGEMARLTESTPQNVQRDRVAGARTLAMQHKVHVVLKGARTVIAHPDGSVFINPTGNAGMASGGMGDVLTGIIAGLMVQGFSPEAAAHAGVYLHGAAADMLATRSGAIGYLARDVMDILPTTLNSLNTEHGRNAGFSLRLADVFLGGRSACR
jgi:NAD(P)H-hydrate epimerase